MSRNALHEIHLDNVPAWMLTNWDKNTGGAGFRSAYCRMIRREFLLYEIIAGIVGAITLGICVTLIMHGYEPGLCAIFGLMAFFSLCAVGILYYFSKSYKYFNHDLVFLNEADEYIKKLDMKSSMSWPNVERTGEKNRKYLQDVAYDVLVREENDGPTAASNKRREEVERMLFLGQRFEVIKAGETSKTFYDLAQRKFDSTDKHFRKMHLDVNDAYESPIPSSAPSTK
jgi:hypothetical protein